MTTTQRQLHPPFASELEAPLAELASHGPMTLTRELLPSARELHRAWRVSDDELSRQGRIHLTEDQIPATAEHPALDVLICRPAEPHAPAPGIVNAHGGGLVSGDNRTDIGALLDWVEEFGVVVVSIEYRLAPEHPHPAPSQDCYAGLLWTVDHADALGIDPDRLLIAGTSAGGGLAAATALRCRDQAGPGLIGQILMSPMLDDRNQTPSSHELIGEGVWDRASNLFGWEALLGDARGSDDVSPYAAPARETDLSALPPTFLDVGSVDTFRDEVVDYAARIWQGGGSAELHIWSGGFHGFEILAPHAAMSHTSKATRTAWLHRLLNQ